MWPAEVTHNTSPSGLNITSHWSVWPTEVVWTTFVRWFTESLGKCEQIILVECCFTSTETVALLGTGAQDDHFDFHTAPEFWQVIQKSLATVLNSGSPAVVVVQLRSSKRRTDWIWPLALIGAWISTHHHHPLSLSTFSLWTAPLSINLRRHCNSSASVVRP